jgi:hypothetical protein
MIMESTSSTLLVLAISRFCHENTKFVLISCPYPAAEGYPIPLQPETQGDTDRLIGKWMKGRSRDKVILATKVFFSE